MKLKALFGKLKTASSLSLNQWETIGLAYCLLLKARLLLLLSPPRAVEQALNQRREISNRKRSYPKEELLRLFYIAWRSQPGRPNCLPTALAQQALLSRYGFPAQFRIGVLKENGKFQAHAWCEENRTLGKFQAVESLER